MKFSKILSFCILSIVCIQLQAQQIVGYAPYYRTYSANFDFTKYTHIHFFSIWPNADGSFNYPQSQDSLSLKKKFDDISAKANGAKMIMTFGGTHVNGSKHFEELSTDETARKNFVTRVIALCKAWNIDGVDIDWEGLSGANAKQGNIDLMTDLRKATTENNLSLSIDVPASAYSGNNYDVNAIDLADYINVMGYEYNGSWSKTALHHANMNKIVSLGLDYWTGKGLSKNKLNLGCSFYAKKYTGTSTVGSSFTKAITLTFEQVQTLINSGYTVMEDNTDGSYCYSKSKNEIVFYDSPKNASHKINYASQNGYSGVIIWEIGQDDRNQSLATALDDARKVLTPIHDNFEKKVNFELKNKVLEISSEDNVIVEIYNSLGSKILHSTNKEIDLSSLSSNLYFLIITTDESSSKEKIFIF